MLAQPSPKTLSFSTPTVRNQRTLVWLQHQTPSVPWHKWNTIVTSLEDYHRWKAICSSITAVLITNSHDAEYVGQDTWLDELYRISKNVTFILLPRVILQWKSEDYWKENFDNVLCIDDLHEQYPFLGPSWNGSVEDAIHLFAVLCRYHRLVDVHISSESTRLLYDLKVEQGTRPAELVLYTQYYSTNSKARTSELRDCLRRNAKSKWIDRIVLLNEKDESVAWASFSPSDASKIEQRVIGTRLCYSDFFKEVQRSHELLPQERIAVLANADIYFGEETAELWNISLEDRALCLLRWDDLGTGPKKAKVFGPRPDSQDVWIFSSTSIASRRWNWDRVSLPLGKPGCDNAILHGLLQHRFLLSNPSLSLKTYHLHNSGVRSYQSKDTIHSPVYIHLEPTYLIDTKQEMIPQSNVQHLCNEVVSFTVHSSSMSNEITYCTMLERDGRYKWEPTVENFYFEPAIPVYTWSNGTGVGVTGNGLVYDLYRIYTGRHAVQQPRYNYWKEADVDLFTPLSSCSRMAVIPFANTNVFGQWYYYVLYYLSRYLRLRELEVDKELEFWSPSEFGGMLERLDDWKDARQWTHLGVEWRKGVVDACWATEAVGFLPSPAIDELGREDISILRRFHPTWSATPHLQPQRKCLIVRDALLTKSLAERLREILPPSWNIEFVDVEESAKKDVEREEKWIGASLVLVVGGPNTHKKWTPLWLLPKGTVFLEFQPELTVDGECQHVAHVADLSPWIFLLGKGSMEQQQDQIIEDVGKWWKKNHAVFSSSL
jgi:hypothetical protein